MRFSVLFVLVALIVTFSVCLSVKERRRIIASKNHKANDYVPVYVMMPLDIVTNDGQVKNPTNLFSQLSKLKSGGVDGIMIDMWWGIVERNGPKQYDFSAYKTVTNMCKQIGLRMQFVLSFHKCGTNVGDACYIELPSWVRAIGNSNPDIYYTDREGYHDDEYLSLGVDWEPLWNGRTAVIMYTDLMRAFAAEFDSYFGGTIVTVEVGLGPAGELRYPSYQLQQNRWKFPGIGEFQCYDKYMLEMLKKHANETGHMEWSHGGPSNAGNYNSRPFDTGFFSNSNHNNNKTLLTGKTKNNNSKNTNSNTNSDNWNSDYGKFFLSWYSSMLLDHADHVLNAANSVFSSKNVQLAAKVAGIHWWYFTDSHAAELTAGYYNVGYHDGYRDIVNVFKRYNVEFQFTCLEMRNAAQQDCACGPENLVAQTRADAFAQNVHYSGENALPVFDYNGYSQIVSQSKAGGKAISGFTYLRMCDQLFDNNNWNTFTNFVNRMHNV